MTFPLTESALDRDSVIGWRPLLVISLLVGLVCAVWLVAGRVELTESTDLARLEAGQAVHPVDAVVGGRVLAVPVRLGQQVAAGDPLIAIDDDEATAVLEEAEGRRTHQEERMSAARRELAAEEQLAAEERRSAEAALGEARAHAKEAQAEVRLAETELEYVRQLRASGLVSEQERVRRVSEAERKRAALEAGAGAVTRLEADLEARGSRSAGRLAHLREEVTTAAEELAALKTRIGLMRQQVAERVVRAPVAGHVGRLTPLRPGSVVAAGTRVADIVPLGTVRAVADFPMASVGRLAPGQPARLRLAAYPWTEFGSVRARVREVGTEPHAGHVRVELDLEDPLPPGIVPAHGLVGSLTVEVERVPPLLLAVRTAGGLSRRRP